MEEGPNFRGTAPAILGRHRDAVEGALREALSAYDSEIGTVLRYHLGWVDEWGSPISSDQGKSLRSSLCMFGCEAVGGEPEQALFAAVAVELIHSFSLIHDDIQDGDRERRHRPTVWSIWGWPKAIQAGNVMRTLAGMAIQRNPRDKVSLEVMATCSRVLTDACLEMIEGQYLDMDYEGRTDIDTSSYLRMISRKTGALIRCSLQMGAMAGGGDTRTIQAAARCGQVLGAVFQIRDDYLGVWGREEDTGKPAGSDLRRKKNSLPLVYALERAGADEREQLRSIYARGEVEDQDVSRMKAMLEELGAEQYAETLAHQQAKRAMATLEGIELVQGAREDLYELVGFLLTRDR